MLDPIQNQNALIITSSAIALRKKDEESPSEEIENSELSAEDQKKIDELKARENEVIAHEHAHRMAGGRFVRGAIQYEYEVGPDNRRYISGGEVNIDTTPVEGDPQATVQKMQIIQRAALAPIDPSAQDRKVAQEARRQEMKARMELMQNQFSGEVETDENPPVYSYMQNGESISFSNILSQSRIDIYA